MSACELTDTYSPAAIDIAPATSPAMPAIRRPCVRVRGGDADDQARGGDDAVVGAEHGGAQPADALGAMSFLAGRVPVDGSLSRPLHLRRILTSKQPRRLVRILQEEAPRREETS